MSTIKTIADILTEYRVSEKQIAAVTIENNGATVTSQSNGPDHQVRYNKHYRRLTCTCAAGQDGRPCWAQRATLAKLAINRLDSRAIVEDCMTDASIPQTAEAAQVEAWVAQGIDRETATRVAYATGTLYSEREIKDAQARYAQKDFCLLK